jgi:hypothetical protein
VNVRRGLFRAWILLTVVWLIGVITMAYMLVPDEVGQWKWQYVHEMRRDLDLEKVDWTRPYYENMRSPSIEKLAVTFSQLGDEYVDEWNDLVNDGKINTVSFPDHSVLYLETNLTKEDQEYLSGAFWNQRWWRYGKIAGTWTAIAVMPAVAVLIICWALLWVARDLKH